MAQERHVSPEKQLLSLIEEPDAKTARAKVYTAKRHGLSFVSPAAWKSRISFFKQSFAGSFKSGEIQQPDIRSINKVLGLAAIFLTAYFISRIYFSMVSLQKAPDLDMKVQSDAEAMDFSEKLLLKDSTAYYLEKVKNRNIFQMGAKEAEDIEKDIKPKGPSANIIEATQHLKLVGISWSGDPDVMIEDTKALRTFFVKKGDYVGEVKIEDVLKDKVVLSYNGEEIDLK